MPEPKKITDRRQREWWLNRVRWCFLLDSLEGGQAYRDATYGTDDRGFPVRNLVRHKREYPEPMREGTQTGPLPGQDQAASATSDDYELRRARTPVPVFLREAVETHLSHVYTEEIKRETNVKPITEWWEDVDGKGNTIDQWMQDTIAPLLMTLGQIDLVFDHPKAPTDATVETQADVIEHGLDRVVASHILPENVVWWELDARDRYTQVLVCEPSDDPKGQGKPNYRHWRADGWTLYAPDGKALDEGTYGYGRPPIVRVFDKRKPRSRFTGQPRYEFIAECQREYYNRASELVLTDTLHAHPILQGPEDLIQDGSIAIGPGWMLPKKKLMGTTPTYEGFDVIDFPQGGADSLRENMQGMRDAIDRDAQLIKPAGAQGTDGNTVSQSGISKRLDQSGGNKLLAQIAAVLERCEWSAAEMVALVAGVEWDAEKVTINYPREFDLWTADDLTLAILSLQQTLEGAGNAPETELALLKKLIRLLMPGLDDAEYGPLDDELEAYLNDRKSERDETRKAGVLLAQSQALGIPNGQPNAEPNGDAIDDESAAADAA